MSELRACYYRNLGMAGSAAIGHLVRAAADKTAAASERIFVRLLTSSAIRGWRVNYIWNPPDDERTIDVAFVRERLAIEIDGWAWHHTGQVPERPNQAERPDARRLDGFAVHLVRPDNKPGVGGPSSQASPADRDRWWVTINRGCGRPCSRTAT